MDRILHRRVRTGPSTLAFHVSRIVTDAGMLVAMAAMSMPFVTTDGADKGAVAADALPVILLLAPAFVFTLIPDHSRPVPAPLGWVSLGLGLAALPFAVVKYLDATTLADTLGGSVGFGARLLVLGTLITLAGIALGLARTLLHLTPRSTDGPRRPSPAARRPQAGVPRPPHGARTAGRTAPSQSARAAPDRAASRQDPDPVPPARRVPPETPQPRPRSGTSPTRGVEPVRRQPGSDPAPPARRMPPADPRRPDPGNG